MSLLIILVAGSVPIAFGSPPATGAAPPPQGPSGGLPPGTPLSAMATSFGGWDPGSGHSSPGAPTYRLTTMSRAYGAGAGWGSQPPAWMAYDRSDTSFWVATPPGAVSVFQVNPNGVGWNYTALLAVGTDPFGVAVDNATGDVFVTNTGSDNVTVLNSTTWVTMATVQVGTSPYGIAYDWRTDEMYVANGGSNNVTILSASNFSVVATIPVGEIPVGVAADPQTGRVFVADSGSGNVTVISTTTQAVLASILTGNGSYGVALDTANDEIFVTNTGNDTISVIDAATSSVLTTITVFGGATLLQGIAYDAGTGMIWAGAGWYYIVVINATNDLVVGYAGTDPAGVAYDPDNGDICVTNTGNKTFACLSFAEAAAITAAAFTLVFQEQGLPSGTPWTVHMGQLSGPNATATTQRTQITFGTYPSPLSYLYQIPIAGGYLAVPNQGSVVTEGQSTFVNVTFAAAGSLYAVTFLESGLPSGTFWSVDLAGANGPTNSTTTAFLEPNGTYNFTLGTVAGYSATPSAGYVTVNGGPAQVDIAFTALPPPTDFNITFTERGLPSGTVWTVLLGGTSYYGYSVMVIQRSDGTYPWSVQTVVGYSSTLTPQPIVVRGAPVNAYLNFTRAAASPYLVTFIEGGLPLGSTWWVQFNGSVSSSFGTTIVFSAPTGNYTFNVTGPIGYTPAPASGVIDVVGAVQVDVYFSVTPAPPLYPVNVSEQGLPAKTSWSIDIGGSLYSAGVAWITTNLSNGTYEYQAGGESGYFPTPSVGYLTVLGRPAILEITYTQVNVCCPPLHQPPQGTNGTYYEGIAIGLVGGILLGIVIMGAAVWIGRRAGPPPSRP